MIITEVSERSIETGGRRLAWLEAGAGWPIVLLHAFPLTAEMWRPQLQAVPQGWRFIAPELRRVGPITIDDYAADVLSLMDALELEEAVIGGLSMGGYVTFAMFRQDPSRFTGMVLADTRPQADTPQARDGRVKMREMLAKDGPRGVAGQMLPTLLAERTRRDRPDVVERVRAMIESSPAEAIDAAIGALMGRPDSTPDLPGISCATLIVVGELDEVTPVAEAQLMQRAMPRSTLTVIAGAAHLSNLDQPDAFLRTLEDFLRGHL